MQSEIEAKFLNIDHDGLRKKLVELGGVCEQPMRLMRRVVIHNQTMSSKNAFVRVRDEGYRTTMTYKQFDADTVDGAKEYEVTVGDFDAAIAILDAAGLTYDTYQESQRENWRLKGIEIMLDEWPWLNPYIEIEGGSEKAVKSAAEILGLKWGDAVFGGVANVYQLQYPHIGEEGKYIINNNWPVIKFIDPLPALLKI